jgi:putative transposase
MVSIQSLSRVFGRVTVAVSPAYTNQECPKCHVIVKKSLSARTYVCRRGCELDRDHASAIIILNKGLGTVGHTGTLALDASNASGDSASILVGENLPGQAESLR